MLNRDIYVVNFPVASFSHNILYLSHFLFRDMFSNSLDIYKRLGQFDYDQPSCTTDLIRTFIKDNKWVYSGEVKEGTDDTPHGIGIQVWCSGGTQQLGNSIIE